ncbi:thiazolylpeptide-type bacteriocin [Streptomyces sp. NPDC001250]|uniref:thiazolylpeptide-type bacteriocin n=1 Tax=unclassified Streptomyces TaxID=2593676 RepID=UPI00331D4B56
MDSTLSQLAEEMQALESETFEITDYADSGEVMMDSSCSCTSSSTTSSTSCCA